MAKDLGTQTPNSKQAVEELKPQCREYTGFQFADMEGGSAYIGTRFDADNQELPMNRPFDHAEATAGEGMFGRFQHEDVDRSGTSASMSGYNEIPYGTGAAFPNGPSTVVVDTSRADRGRES